MKKQIIIIAVAFLSFGLSYCANEDKKSATTDSQEVKEVSTETTDRMADAEKSVLNWKGEKPAGSHNGTIKLKSGSVAIQNNEITGGEFLFDMSSIKVLDIEDEAMNTKLTGHLKAADFFAADTFPTAKFVVTEISKSENADFPQKVKGNLTVKGITKNIGFNAKLTVNEGGNFEAISETFTIDRTEWGIEYNSGKFFEDLKDKLIKDEIELSFHVFGK